jgi:hypothetical protein
MIKYVQINSTGNIMSQNQPYAHKLVMDFIKLYAENAIENIQIKTTVKENKVHVIFGGKEFLTPTEINKLDSVCGMANVVLQSQTIYTDGILITAT